MLEDVVQGYTMDKIWIVWAVLAGIFFVGEIFTAGFFLLWFAIGAAVAAVLAGVGLSMPWHVGGFAVVSAVLFAFSRRFAERVTSAQPPGIGADRFVGEYGVVLEDIDETQNSGCVRVGQDEWRAQSDTGHVIAKGTRVQVVRMNGTRVVVKAVEQGE